MELIFESVGKILSFDRSYLDIVFLSLYVSILATLISAIISIIIASHMASTEFFGKNIITILVNTFMSIPPVVVGLVLYIVFSASGVLGFMDILYSPSIMIIAQFIIVTPIIISLSLKSLTEKYEYLGEFLISLNASKKQINNTIIYESRFNLLIIIITGLSRALSEVGAVIIVGGNIDSLTRVMTTSIVLETSRGELSLALSLGISLLIIALIMNIVVSSLKSKIL
ncbi:MAG: ABC transporter permease [Pseudomonadota bacterium]|nr:ABC transporter permease [Pseudomonadota bacterium]